MTPLDWPTTQLLLQTLLREGPKTDKQLESVLDVDQITEEDISSWVGEMIEKDMVAEVTPGSSIRRVHITETGRKAIPDPRREEA